MKPDWTKIMEKKSRDWIVFVATHHTCSAPSSTPHTQSFPTLSILHGEGAAGEIARHLYSTLFMEVPWNYRQLRILHLSYHSPREFCPRLLFCWRSLKIGAETGLRLVVLGTLLQKRCSHVIAKVKVQFRGSWISLSFFLGPCLTAPLCDVCYSSRASGP